MIHIKIYQYLVAFMYEICHLKTGKIWLLPFWLIYSPYPHSFSYLKVLVKVMIPCRIRVTKMDSCCSTAYKKRFPFFHSVMLRVCHIYPFSLSILSVHNKAHGFNHEALPNFLEFLHHLMWSYGFHPSLITDYICCFVDAEPSLHSWDMSHLIVVNNIPHVLLDSVY